MTIPLFGFVFELSVVFCDSACVISSHKFLLSDILHNIYTSHIYFFTSPFISYCHIPSYNNMVCKKCSLCSKRIKNHALVEKNRCNSCHKYFHFKCLGLKDGSSSKSWNCHYCLLNNLPFFNLDNSKLKLTLEGRSAEDSVGLK